MTELSWRCCPGFMGEGCHDSPTDQPGLLPQHPSPKMPPGQKMFPMPRLPPYPKSHPDLFPGPKNQYGEILLLLHVPRSPYHCSLCSSTEHESGKNSVSDIFSIRDLTFDCFLNLVSFKTCSLKIAFPHCFREFSINFGVDRVHLKTKLFWAVIICCCTWEQRAGSQEERRFPDSLRRDVG